MASLSAARFRVWDQLSHRARCECKSRADEDSASSGKSASPRDAITMAGEPRGCSSAGRASGWQPEGQGFEPPQLHSAKRPRDQRGLFVALAPAARDATTPHAVRARRGPALVRWRRALAAQPACAARGDERARGPPGGPPQVAPDHDLTRSRPRRLAIVGTLRSRLSAESAPTCAIGALRARRLLAAGAGDQSRGVRCARRRVRRARARGRRPSDAPVRLRPATIAADRRHRAGDDAPAA